MQTKSFSTKVGDKELIAEFSDLADQANGSVIVRYGNTAILATAVMSRYPNEGAGYFPLTVDYEERFYAAGEILGSRFVRREGRPTDEAILSGRVVDRTIRPLFDPWIRHDIQVVLTVLSIDEDDPDVLGVIAASLALGTSDIPWNGPVSAIRIAETAENRGLDADKRRNFLVNPSYKERKKLELDLLACGKDGKINMIEVGANQATESIINDALLKASEEIEIIQEWQKKIIKDIGKTKYQIPAPAVPEELKKLFADEIEKQMDGYIFAGPGKPAGKEP